MGMTTISQRLADVQARVAAACAAANRDPSEVRLIAVSKGHPAESIAQAHAAGQRHFGESRGQALAAKAHELPSDIAWHFIGPLQTNKVRIVRPHATMLHSFDRDSLVGPWLKGLGAPPAALMQVNVGSEQQKAGVEPTEAVTTFLRWAEAGVVLEGVMAIPPLGESPQDTRPYFDQLRMLRDELATRVGRNLELSMGMTNDFEVAVDAGSTMIRVGTAIFGPRPTVVIK